MSISLNSNSFELFGLEPRFEVPLDHLSTRFRELQKVYHPDRYVNEDSAARRQAVQLAAHINAAYESLKDPLSRAVVLLQLKSGASASAEGANDIDFLMQQMAFRERLESVSSSSEPLAEVDRLKAELKSAFDGLCSQFSSDYEAGRYDAAQDTVSKLKFFRRLLESLAETEARLEDELF